MRRRAQSGMTVLEVLVAAALFSIFLAAAMSFYLVHQRASARGQEKVEVQQNARVALTIMAREIRMAGYDLDAVIAALSEPTPIQDARDDRLTFLADVDDDGKLDRVTFRLERSRLMRDSASWNGGSFSATVSSEVAEGIVALSFEYFDGELPENNRFPTPVAQGSLEQIRSINVGLVVRRPSTADSEETFLLGTDLSLRNLR